MKRAVLKYFTIFTEKQRSKKGIFMTERLPKMITSANLMTKFFTNFSKKIYPDKFKFVTAFSGILRSSPNKFLIKLKGSINSCFLSFFLSTCFS